ncbi:replicative DNA helicase [Candidatus Saccharibacteria bacterium]|nr:replicative DNA helicase [Candidatus Saccharibacteria bacterium]
MPHSDAAPAGKVTPQDIEAERSLLGAVLRDDDLFPDVLERVAPEDFYDKKHVTIFRAMKNLYEHNQQIDLVTIRAELSGKKLLKEIGGATYLADLTNSVPTTAHALSYADLVEKASIRRRLIKAGTTIVEGAYDGEKEVGELLGDAEKTLFEVSDKNVKSDYTPLSDLLVDAFNRMEKLHKNRGALRGLKTGFADLDKWTAGLQKGDLIIVGARPAMGKTTFAQNLAVNAAEINQKTVLFFSMEMAKAEIIDRMISPAADVDAWNIRTGNISDEEFSRIGDALGEMSDIPLLIDDTSNMTILELRNKARRAAHDHDIGLIIVDYLQLIQGSDRYAGNRVQEVTEISRGLKILARELEVPVVALAQLSRNVTGRDDPRPILSDLRESGSIEQDADLVMFLHRVDYYNKNKPDYVQTNITELIMAKHRHGPTETIELFFDSKKNRFLTIDKKHESEK